MRNYVCQVGDYKLSLGMITGLFIQFAGVRSPARHRALTYAANLLRLPWAVVAKAARTPVRPPCGDRPHLLFSFPTLSGRIGFG